MYVFGPNIVYLLHKSLGCTDNKCHFSMSHATLEDTDKKFEIPFEKSEYQLKMTLIPKFNQNKTCSRNVQKRSFALSVFCFSEE